MERGNISLLEVYCGCQSVSTWLVRREKEMRSGDMVGKRALPGLTDATVPQKLWSRELAEKINLRLSKGSDVHQCVIRKPLN